MQCFAYDAQSNECDVLIDKPYREKCAKCKFFKTDKQFDNAMQEAEDSLRLRSLKRKQITRDGEKIVTAVPDYD